VACVGDVQPFGHSSTARPCHVWSREASAQGQAFYAMFHSTLVDSHLAVARTVIVDRHAR
jgi:hypothetical protein